MTDPRVAQADRADPLWRRLERASLPLFALSMAALGVTAVVFQSAVPGLQPTFESSGLGAALPVSMGAVISVASLGLLAERRLQVAGAWTLFAVWMGLFLLGHVPGLISAPGDFTRWVSSSQAAIFALTALALTGGRLIRLIRRWAVGSMLILFGAVHLAQVQLISSLIPEYLPLRSVWPWFTGPIQIVCGIAIGLGWQAVPAAAVTGGMYVLWIALLHAPRLVGAPQDHFEWTFLLTAAVLAATVWLAGFDMVASYSDRGAKRVS